MIFKRAQHEDCWMYFRKAVISTKLGALNIQDANARKQHFTAIHEGKKQKTSPTTGGSICPRCGGELVKRKGKNGEFIGCENFPQCRYTSSPKSF